MSPNNLRIILGIWFVRRLHGHLQQKSYRKSRGPLFFRKIQMDTLIYHDFRTNDYNIHWISRTKWHNSKKFLNKSTDIQTTTHEIRSYKTYHQNIFTNYSYNNAQSNMPLVSNTLKERTCAKFFLQAKRELVSRKNITDDNKK